MATWNRRHYPEPDNIIPNSPSRALGGSKSRGGGPRTLLVYGLAGATIVERVLVEIGNKNSSGN
jgi:hypothetical protein